MGHWPIVEESDGPFGAWAPERCRRSSLEEGPIFEKLVLFPGYLDTFWSEIVT